MSTKPRGSRAQSPEIVELQKLRTDHPDLADAADLQIALLELQRRVHSRVPLPWIQVDAAWLKRQQEAGVPLLRFEDIPIEWTDFNLMFRETAELLRRYQSIDEEDYRAAQRLAREGHDLKPLAVWWYNATAAPDAAPREAVAPASEMVQHVILLAMRPFLMRCAEGMLARFDVSGWRQGRCPLCGGEPEFAAITPAAERQLICSRCTGRWIFHPLTCPFCHNDDRTRITSFASRDGLYRIYACDVCRRYIKAYDGRAAARPVMVPVDSVATLPLDAAAIQKGYSA